MSLNLSNQGFPRLEAMCKSLSFSSGSVEKRLYPDNTRNKDYLWVYMCIHIALHLQAAEGTKTNLIRDKKTS